MDRVKCPDIPPREINITDSWRQVKKSKISPSQWKNLLQSGGFTNAKGDLWYPDSSSFRGSVVSDAFNVPQGLTTDEEWNSVKTYLSPVLIGLKNCENVLLEDCLFQNSPCWNIHPLMCKNVIINGRGGVVGNISISPKM